MKKPTQKELENLWGICQDFVRENDIYSGYNISFPTLLSPAAKDNSSKLICRICEIVGYKK